MCCLLVFKGKIVIFKKLNYDLWFGQVDIYIYIYIYKLGPGWTDGLIFHALVVSF